jgi:hypothetical protein
VSAGDDTVTDTYREYVYIYLPGILGAVIALFSVQLPLVGRKWSLVISAALQGLSMAMYTQVKTTAGYVGLNALEYVMQTVSSCINQVFPLQIFELIIASISTLCFMRLRQRCLTPPIARAQVVCCPAWAVSPASLHLLPARLTWVKTAPVFCGLALVVSGFQHLS